MQSSPEAVFDRLRQLVLDTIVEHEMNLLERPHIAICEFDPRVAPPSYLGPYPSAAEALEAAHQEEQSLRRELPDVAVRVSIAPLAPPPPAAHGSSPAGESREP